MGAGHKHAFQVWLQILRTDLYEGSLPVILSSLVHSDLLNRAHIDGDISVAVSVKRRAGMLLGIFVRLYIVMVIRFCCISC